MNVVRGTCRARLNGADLDFILRTLGLDPGNLAGLTRLLADPEARDDILDHERLYQAVLEHPDCLTISSHLYFYVLVRRTLRSAGFDQRMVADYVADVLSEFMRTERAEARLPGEPGPFDTFVEMLAALPRLEPWRAFTLRAHMGNQALYYTGLFAERVEQRARRRGAPAIRYYEGMGESSFSNASRDRYAIDLGLARVFEILAEGFHEARLALNELAERLLSLGDSSLAVERLLVRA